MLPIYEPPYGSPIEDRLAYHSLKYLSEETKFVPQFHANTICGNFHLDFVWQCRTSWRVGIECDGKEFHEGVRDEWRDAIILGEKHVDAIYRIDGADINLRIIDVLFVLSSLEPTLFSERGRINLRTLASPEATSQMRHSDAAGFDFFVSYRRAQSYDVDLMRISRRLKDDPINVRQFWPRYFEYAQKLGGGPIESLIESYEKESN